MKNIKKLLTSLALVGAIGCSLGLAACGPDDSADDNKGGGGGDNQLTYVAATQAADHWTNYTFEQYEAEDVSAKTVAYQFSDGVLDFAGQITYYFMLNLYSDGYAKMIQYADLGQLESLIWYYGNWEYDSEDKLIGISLRFSASGEEHHEDGFSCEAEIDGGTMYCTAPCDKYFNVYHDGSVELTTKGEKTFASFDAFKTAHKAPAAE